MKFAVVVTTTVTTKELYEVEIAEHLDPLDYISSSTPVSIVTTRELGCDIFRKETKE